MYFDIDKILYTRETSKQFVVLLSLFENVIRTFLVLFDTKVRTSKTKKNISWVL